MTKTMGAPESNTANEIIHVRELVNQVLSEGASVSHGIVTLEIHIRDGRPVRAVVSRSRSMILEGGSL